MFSIKLWYFILLLYCTSDISRNLKLLLFFLKRLFFAGWANVLFVNLAFLTCQVYRRFAICYRCETFTYLQISCSFWLLADFILACDQHIFVDVFLQTFHRGDRQVELNRSRRTREDRQQQDNAESRHATCPWL